jgi:hypothetical protein
LYPDLCEGEWGGGEGENDARNQIQNARGGEYPALIEEGTSRAPLPPLSVPFSWMRALIADGSGSPNASSIVGPRVRTRSARC